MDILTRIRDGMSSFSKNHKKIATYIVQNYDKAAFMTANKLGNTVEVSESTVVRFAVELGYDGYPKMQKALQEIVRNKLTSVQRIEITNTKFDSKNILKSALFSDIDNIRQTLEINNTEIFETAADKIISAKKVYVLATRSAAMLANFMSYYFKIILPYIRVVNCNSAAEMLEADKNYVLEYVDSNKMPVKKTVNAIVESSSADGKYTIYINRYTGFVYYKNNLMNFGIQEF